MATYKVLQDIEAEDKLLGPLSLRQFIYAVIVVVLGFIAFQLATVNVFAGIPFLIPMAFFGLLAAPFGVYQSSEIWLLGKIRYFIFPKKRIWDQSGIEELVTITVPKQLEDHFSDKLGQEEVKSRLEALAKTLDSRGWILRNQTQTEYQTPQSFGPGSSQRLVTIPNLPDQNSIGGAVGEDVQDQDTSVVAQNMNTLLNQSEQSRKIAIQQQIADSRDKENSLGAIMAKVTSTPLTPEPSAALPLRANIPTGKSTNKSVEEPTTASMTIDHSGGKIKDVAKVEQPKAEISKQPTQVSTSEDGEVTISLH